MRVPTKLSSVVLVSALFACIPWPLSADTVVSVGSASLLNDVFNIPVNVSDVSDLFAFQFDLSYDPAVLELLSISEGPFLPAAGSTIFVPGTIDNTAGTATVTADTLTGAISGATGSGELAIFSFKNLAQGNSALGLSNVALLDSSLDDIAFTTTDGQFISTIPEPRPLPLLVMLLAAALAAGKYRIRA